MEDATPEPRTFRYRAFISYSHRDEAAALWLHRALETYTVPRSLLGTAGRDGPLPRRLTPVFRDRDELPASADLGQTLRQALEDSAVLLVLCSPEAAQSRWVNEEVLSFKRLGRTGRVLAIIVQGEPHDPAQECFPPALRFQMTPEGELTDIPAEPIAPDLRAGGDGRERVLLKTVAGLLGVPFDLLYARERRRQKRHRLLMAVASLLLLAAFLGTWQWRTRMNEAQLARAAQERARQKTRFEGEAAAEEGRLSLVAGDPWRALPALKRAAELGPDDPAARLMLGLARHDLAGLKHVLSAHEGGIVRMAASADGTKALTFGEEGTATIWNLTDGSALYRLGEPKGQAQGFERGSFSPDGKWAALTRTFRAGTVVIDLASGAQRQLSGLLAAVFTADGRLAVAIDKYQAPTRFGWIDPATGTLTEGSPLPLSCERLEVTDTEGRTALFSARVERAWHHLWVDLATGATIADLPDARGNDGGPALSPDGSKLILPTREGFEIRSREGVVGKLLAQVPLSPGSMLQAQLIPFAVGWAAHGRLIVSVNQGASCAVWSAEGKLLRTWNDTVIPELAVHPEEPLAAFTRDDGRVEIRDLDSGALAASFFDLIGRRSQRTMISARTASICFLPHTPLLLSAWESREAKVWAWRETHVALRESERRIGSSDHIEGIGRLAWSDDGRLLAGHGDDGQAILWDTGPANSQTELQATAFGPHVHVWCAASLGSVSGSMPPGRPDGQSGWLPSVPITRLLPLPPAPMAKTDAEAHALLSDLNREDYLRP